MLFIFCQSKFPHKVRYDIVTIILGCIEAGINNIVLTLFVGSMDRFLGFYCVYNYVRVLYITVCCTESQITTDIRRFGVQNELSKSAVFSSKI